MKRKKNTEEKIHIMVERDEASYYISACIYIDQVDAKQMNARAGCDKQTPQYIGFSIRKAVRTWKRAPDLFSIPNESVRALWSNDLLFFDRSACYVRSFLCLFVDVGVGVWCVCVWHEFKFYYQKSNIRREKHLYVRNSIQLRVWPVFLVARFFPASIKLWTSMKYSPFIKQLTCIHSGIYWPERKKQPTKKEWKNFIHKNARL